MKKIFLSVLVLVSMFSQAVTQAASFVDTDDRDIEIEFLAESGVVEGRSEGVYAPDEFVNRAETMKILLESINVSPDEDEYKNCFPDVKEEWFARYVCYAKEKGIVSGHPDGTFRPADNVNLAEALKMTLNSFNIGFEVEDDDTDWYSAFVDGGEAYDIADQGYNAGDYISRRAMAELVSRVAVVSVTESSFNVRALQQVRGEGYGIQSLSDNVVASYLSEVLTTRTDDDWIVKITSSDGDRFEILFSHEDEPFIAEEGVDELILPPTIEIEEGTGIADIGLDANLSWDGLVSPVAKSALVDADLYGFFDASLNLQYFPDQKKVYIYSALKELEGTFDLETGAVTGDEEITLGVTDLNDYFEKSGGKPFTVCVSDRVGYMGEVGIFDDFETVGVRECPYYKPETEEEPPIVINAIPEFGWSGESGLGGGGDSGKKIFPRIPGGGEISLGGGTVADPWSDIPITPEPWDDNPDDGDWLEPEPEEGSVTEDPDTGVPESFPRPDRNPGEGYENPEYDAGRADETRKKNEDVAEKNDQIARDNGDIFEKGQEDIEDLMKHFDVDIPDEEPSFDSSKCCPSGAQYCCSDLDLNTKEGRDEYDRRLKCLHDEMDKLEVQIYIALQNVNFWSGRIKSLEKAQAVMGQLTLFTDLQKKLSHVAIDVATGGASSWLTGVIAPLIGEFFGDDFGDAFSIGADPEGASDTVKENIKGKIEGKIAEMTGFADKVGEIAGSVADTLGLTGSARERFVENIKGKFGESPTNIVNPAEWLKAVVDAILDSVGGAAEDFNNDVDKIKAKFREDLLTAWEAVVKYRQANAILQAMRENCGPKYREGIRAWIEELKRIQEEYVKGINEDGQYILDALKWILDNEFWDFAEDNPDPEVLKQRIIERLKQLLCRLGFDLCWVDIEFDLEYTSDTGDRSYRWRITGFTITKRDTKKEDCECEEEDVIEDDTGDDVGDDTGDVSETGYWYWNDSVSDYVWVEGTECTDVGECLWDDYLGGYILVSEYDTGDDYCETCYCDGLTVESFVNEIQGLVWYDPITEYVYDMDCYLNIPDSYVLESFAEFYGSENEWLVWEFFTYPDNEGLIYSFYDGTFYNELENRYVNPLE